MPCCSLQTFYSYMYLIHRIVLKLAGVLVASEEDVLHALVDVNKARVSVAVADHHHDVEEEEIEENLADDRHHLHLLQSEQRQMHNYVWELL